MKILNGIAKFMQIAAILALRQEPLFRSLGAITPNDNNRWRRSFHSRTPQKQGNRGSKLQRMVLREQRYQKSLLDLGIDLRRQPKEDACK